MSLNASIPTKDPDETIVVNNTIDDNVDNNDGSCKSETVMISAVSVTSNNDALLTGRAKRQAEIDAMMASFDEAPTYKPYNNNTPSAIKFDSENNDQNVTKSERKQQQQQQQKSDKVPSTKNGVSSQEDEDPFEPIIARYGLPVRNQFLIPSECDEKRRNCSITCLTMDASGSKFTVGTTDSYLRFYDFGSMKGTMPHSAASIVVEDGYWPICCSYDRTNSVVVGSADSYENPPQKHHRILVGTGSVQPTVVFRLSSGGSSESHQQKQPLRFMRGDMYVMDPTKTVGHTAAVTCVDWHPWESSIVVTSSLDGSARLWDIDHGKKQFDMLTCAAVATVKNSKGQRTSVLCVTFHPSGREFAIGTTCGSIQIWKAPSLSSKNFNRSSGSSASIHLHRPERAVFNVFNNDKPVHFLQYNHDGTRIVCRTNYQTEQDDKKKRNSDENDRTVQLWDARKLSRSFSHPILVCCSSRPTPYECSNCDFNSNGTILIVPSTTTGTTRTNAKMNGGGVLNFYDVGSEPFHASGSGSGTSIASIGNNSSASKQQRIVQPFLMLPIPGFMPTLVRWHPKINQILIGCSNGQVCVLYDPMNSAKGVLVPLSKSNTVSSSRTDALTELLQSRAPQGLQALTGEIITPGYIDPSSSSNKKKKQRDDWKLTSSDASSSIKTVTTTAPERPTLHKHRLGKEQTGGIAMTFQQFVADQTANAKKAQIAGKDPREALFQYHDDLQQKTTATTDRNRTKTSAVQKRNLLADKTIEQEEEEARMMKKKPKFF